MITAPPATPVRVTNTGEIPWSGGRWRIDVGETVDVPWDFLASFSNAKSLLFDLSAAKDHLATLDAQGRLLFDFWAPLSSVDGYGRHALAIMEAIRKLGAMPILRDAGWSFSAKPPEYDQEAQMSARRLPSRIGLCMSVPYDKALTNHASAYKIAITQFETDHIPAFHIQQVNKLDHLIVTSSFQPDVWRRSGLRKRLPISVLTPGIDTDFFTHKRPEPDGKFKCLMLGALTGRKDPITAIRMFAEASRGADDWQLTIKTRNAGGLDKVLKFLSIPFRYIADERDPREADIETPFDTTSPGDRRIRFIVADDSAEGVRDWYHSQDCLLWPSKGEGVGLPPLEAMACGMEVVMANNSGMADYAFPEHCWPIKTSHMEPADGPGGFHRSYVKAFGDVGAWWVPDYKEGVRQLRRAYEAWRRGNGKGASAAAFVRAKHTLEIQGRSVLKVVELYAA